MALGQRRRRTPPSWPTGSRSARRSAPRRAATSAGACRRAGDGDRQVGAGVEAVAADDPGLAAVHGAEGVAGGVVELALAHQRQLGVEDHAGGPARPRRRRRCGGRCRPAPRPAAPSAGELLEEDERLDLADPAAGLAALDDQAGGAGLLRRGGLLDRGDLDHEPAVAGPGGVGHGGQVGHGQHERVRGRRQRPAGEGPGRRGADREPVGTRPATSASRSASRAAPSRSSTASAPARATATARRGLGRRKGSAPMTTSRPAGLRPDDTHIPLLHSRTSPSRDGVIWLWTG